MFRMKVVVEKDCIVTICAQQFQRLSHIVGDIDEIAFEAFREPLMPPLVVVEQKNANRMTLSRCFAETELVEQ